MGYEFIGRRGGSKSSGTGRNQSSGQLMPSSSTGGSAGESAASAKRTKKRVVVVMRGAEGERLGGSSASSAMAMTNLELKAKLEQQPIDGSGDLHDMEIEDDEGEGLEAEASGGDFDDAMDLRGPRTGYLTPSAVEGLHRVNLLFAQVCQLTLNIFN